MEVRSNCPRPHSNGPDTGKHLYYNTDSRLWYCFVCGYSGRGENPGDEPTVPHNTYPEISLSERAQALFDILNKGSKTESLIVRAALRYLSTHHVDPLYASFVWGILIDGQDIVFPVFRDNKMIYFQKRNLFNKRFFNPPVESKPLFWSRPVWDEADLHTTCLVVESWMNAVRVDSWMPAVALLGKFVSDAGAEEIAARHKRVIVALDAGEIEASMRICRKLRQFGTEATMTMIPGPPGTDLCDMDDVRFEKMMKEWL